MRQRMLVGYLERLWMNHQNEGVTTSVNAWEESNLKMRQGIEFP